MLDRRRARSTSLRMLPEEVRRWSSFWMPAFIAAVAARECGEVAIVRDAEGDWLREAPLEAGGDCRGEGGSVFKSGAIKRGGVSFGHLKIGSNVLLLLGIVGVRNRAAELLAHVTPSSRAVTSAVS